MKRAGQVLFPLGRTVTTKGIAMRFNSDQIFALLCRHQYGDWEGLSHEDQQANVLALQDGERIMSVYEVPVADAPEPLKVWVITEADRSVTTILFPEEY